MHECAVNAMRKKILTVATLEAANPKEAMLVPMMGFG
jgi:hypothetical protein